MGEGAETPPLHVWAYRLGCLFVLLLCFPSLPELPGGTSLALLLMLACLPIWYQAARLRQAPLLDPLAARASAVILGCLMFLILWSIISVFDAAVPFRAARHLASQMAGIALFLLVLGTVTSRRLPVYLDIACFGLALTSALSFVGYSHPLLREMIFRGSDRSSGFFKNPNQYGMVISALLPVLMALILTTRQRRRTRILCWALLLLGLVACGSKTNLMLSSATTLGVLLVFSMIAYKGAKRIWMALASVLGCVTLVGAVAGLLMTFNPRALRLMLTFLSQDKELASLESRDLLWKNSIDEFLADPVLGQGAGQEITIFGYNDFVPHSHNVLLDYLRTLGAPGFVAMLALLGAALLLCGHTLLRAFRARGARLEHRMLCVGLAIGAMAYVAANMSSDSIGPSTSPFFWLVLFLTAAARRLMGSGEPSWRGAPAPA
ncbi:O-antigen ligase family protein [Amaricoccus solimangrovi]|uniref:O-antigen ligase family protein n=1 Tax=Amaricoccus solimangrovi TaxID=2589815 RepID=A0A501WL65_9RHOB|nr:O-antigen ligase family protein [Amaricoccus solimangrovi]TPE49145.1 O-antigen ligase family protein [Amaricoccus solimangrovi]